MKKYDAIIVGSGPNGFSAAIRLQQAGLKTLLIEGAEQYGGGMRSKEISQPGFLHDLCSAIHPMAFASPFLATLPLHLFGLQFTQAKYELAHPLDSGKAVLLHRDIDAMEAELGADFRSYRKLLEAIVSNWPELAEDVMGPLRFPKHPIRMGAFGMKAMQSASGLAKRFKTTEARALWAGIVGHGMQPFDRLTTAAIGLVLTAIGHRYGWQIPVGGSQAIANALAGYYQSLGGEIELGNWVSDIRSLPEHEVLLLDMTPKQLLELEGLNLTASYRKQLERFRYGMGVFKLDWTLSDPTPFTDSRCQQASTVHLGGTFEEIAHAEQMTAQGKLADKPYVLFAQPSLFDSSRAPAGKHVGWAYCHVPHGSLDDRTEAIEQQIERFAPGFKDTILSRHGMNTAAMQAYNPNYVGGDIAGGVMDLGQLFTRPTNSINPYRTSDKQVYIASSSTPPGGGVHGMCGYHAANTVLKDHFKELTDHG